MKRRKLSQSPVARTARRRRRAARELSRALVPHLAMAGVFGAIAGLVETILGPRSSPEAETVETVDTTAEEVTDETLRLERGAR